MPKDERSTVELLYQVSREVASQLDLKVVLTRLLFATLKTVGSERATIIVLDDNEKPIDSAIVYGTEVKESTPQQLRDTVERGLAGWVIRNRQGALVPDTSKDERWLRRPDDSVDQSGAKSAICLPLVARDKLVGVMTLVHSKPNAFDEESFALARAIADQAGIAVLNARLYADSQRQARVMTSLAAGAMAINASLRLGEVLQQILNETMQILQVRIVAMAMADASGTGFIYRAATGENAHMIVGRQIPAGQGIVGWVANEGRGVIIPAATQDSRFSASDQIPGVIVRAVAAAPIHYQGRLIGVLEAINPISKSFDGDALLVLQGIGSMAGSTIQNAQLFEQLQTAHQRYRDLFDDSVDPIIITDWEGNVTEVNRQAVGITGCSGEELRAMKIGQIHTINLEKTGAGFELLRQYPVSYESEVRSKGGTITPVEVQARRLEVNDAESIQWILRDTTTRKELDTLRSDLAAMVYHDLRSPLANIVSSIEILKTMFPPEELASAESIIAIAQHSIDRIQRLINSLLDINRLEAGQPLGEMQPASVSELITDAVKAVRSIADGRQQTLRQEVAPDLPPVLVDADMIRRVLINLLENASKYTPAENEITAGAEQDGDWVRIWVQDYGLGIPTEEQGRIFDKYTRVKRQGGPRGFGVGLAFCRLAVEAHNGEIWVESEVGKGSKFILTLPVADQ
ncbi:MAG: GAF domain-containing protein [Betaproteobacteria bacterium]